MTITHIVMVHFKPLATDEEIQSVCNGLLALKEECIHPQTKKTYIKSIVGGRENSLESLSAGITHVFVGEFESEEDRKYYVFSDPAHIAFVKTLDDVVEKVQVVDFTQGVF